MGTSLRTCCIQSSGRTSGSSSFLVVSWAPSSASHRFWFCHSDRLSQLSGSDWAWCCARGQCFPKVCLASFSAPWPQSLVSPTVLLSAAVFSNSLASAHLLVVAQHAGSEQPSP